MRAAQLVKGGESICDLGTVLCGFFQREQDAPVEELSETRALNVRHHRVAKRNPIDVDRSDCVDVDDIRMGEGGNGLRLIPGGSIEEDRIEGLHYDLPAVEHAEDGEALATGSKGAARLKPWDRRQISPIDHRSVPQLDPSEPAKGTAPSSCRWKPTA